MESNEINTVFFNSKTKITSSTFKINEPVKSLPVRFCFNLTDLEACPWESLGEGVAVYNHEDYRKNSNYNGCLLSNNYLDYSLPSALFLTGVDEEGHTVSVSVKNFQYWIWVEDPKELCFPGDAPFDLLSNLVNELCDNYDVDKETIHITSMRRYNVIGWQSDSKNVLERKEIHYLMIDSENHLFLKKIFFKLQQNVEEGILRDLNLWEEYVKPELRFKCALDIAEGQWLEISNWKIPEKYYTHNQIEIEVDWLNIRKLNRVDKPIIRKVFWDIEVYSHDGKFGRPTIHLGKYFIFMIGASVWIGGGEKKPEIHNYVFHLGECPPTDKFISVPCYNEFDLMNQFRDFLVLDTQAQYRLTYNGFIYDIPYCFKRQDMWINTERFRNTNQISRFNFQSVFIWVKTSMRQLKPKPKKKSRKKKKASVQQNKENNDSNDKKKYYLPCTGSVCIDLYKYVQEELKPRYQTLDAMIKKYIRKGIDEELPTEEIIEKFSIDYVPIQKFDLSKEKMWKNFRDGKKGTIENAIYNLIDCVGIRILDCVYWKVCDLLDGLAFISYTQKQLIHTSGVQTRGINLITRFAHACDYVINYPVDRNREQNIDLKKYKGATVIEPKRGFYKAIVSVHDFASLYPSLIQQFNICLSTYVTKEQVKEFPSEYIETVKTEEGDHCYVKHEMGIFPLIVTKLKEKRQEVKNMMKNYSKDDAMYGVLDILQLAIKLIANGMYGILGDSTGKIPFRPGAQSITAKGRDSIELAVKLTIEDLEKYRPNECSKITHVECIYGDTGKKKRKN